MKNKVCVRCGHRQDIGEFTKNVTKKDGRNPACRTCHSKWQKAHYRKNLGYYKLKAKKNQRLLRDAIREAQKKPCMDCKKKYPTYVMDFDHRDRDKKKMNLSLMAARSGLRLIQEEIAKCDVVCANCHRERTHGPKKKKKP